MTHTTERVTADDLEHAATWLEEYEAEEGDETRATMLRVAAYLRNEAERRSVEAVTRRIIADRKARGESVATPAVVRQLVRRHMAGIAS